MKITTAIASAGMVLLMSSPLVAAEDHPMGFFITSVGMGQGANLGGLEGADAYCTKLAETAGSTGRIPGVGPGRARNRAEPDGR